MHAETRCLCAYLPAHSTTNKQLLIETNMELSRGVGSVARIRLSNIVWRGPRGCGIQRRGGWLKGHRRGWTERCHLSPVVYLVPRRLHRTPWLSRKCLINSSCLSLVFHLHCVDHEIEFDLLFMLHTFMSHNSWEALVSSRNLCCTKWVGTWRLWVSSLMGEDDDNLFPPNYFQIIFEVEIEFENRVQVLYCNGLTITSTALNVPLRGPSHVNAVWILSI